MSLLARAGRLWRTVAPLRLVQIYGRLWFRLNRVRPDLSPAPALRQQSGRWAAPAARAPSMTTPGRFRFLNAEASLDEAGWDDPARPKLWRYNQHYFEDLQAADWPARRDWHAALIADWIAGNPPAAGSGWEPYTLSLRIVNWCKWALAGETLGPVAIASLAVQARALASRLEWHLLGNHLFVNAKALLFAGHFFDGAEAQAWRTAGLHILERELGEQFLGDGAQFELSPMYHALGLEDLLDLVNLAGAYSGLISAEMIARLRLHSQAAIDWLAALSHPDGEIAFFNDAAFGIAPDNAGLFRYAAELGFAAPRTFAPLEHFGASGYTRIAAGPALLLVDRASIGPAYLPGHAHADSLSFELSLYGQRLFVNSGTGEYGDGPERQRQRGTAAHNTVVVAGENSSEIWGGFRVGRRARVRNLEQGDADGTYTVAASHDGYVHLPGKPQHHRRFRLSNRELVIEDRVSGTLPARARFHLHPNVAIVSCDDAEAELRLAGGEAVRLQAMGGLYAEPSTWHPRFGVSLPNQCLVLPLAAGVASLRVTWS
ncbi:MAG: alginate lyase family protein [Sphingomonas sp.]|uniref:heparinase II/III family protein n=1 Tax=Sphingomonas sp. TaxID=28214 RepID=UPI0025E71296|nr:alginate lyase family protein [Sphingomonas sp.]MBX3565269.1 alginate lyase family protein [Sphingomonas sp.]